jgi:hypothetical protein
MGGYDEGYRAGMQILRDLAHKRIEDLEAKLATCEKYRDAYAECDRIGTQAVRDLEAKLEKAVELAFDECPFRDGTGSYNDWWHYRRKELEALKGQNDE